MDLFEFSKTAGALLGALLFALGTGVLADTIFWHPKPAKLGYNLPVAQAAEGGEAPAEPAPAKPLPAPSPKK